MSSADRCCTILAEAQQGCISYEQARGCGLSADAIYRRARTGRWARILPQVYAIRGAPETWEQRLAAARLWAGESAAVSGRSAAALWGFPGFPRGPVEVSHPGAKKSPKGVVGRRRRLDPSDITRLDRHSVTAPARTLVDVANLLTADSFDVVFHHCLHKRLASLTALRDLARRDAGRAGARLLKEAVDAYRPGDHPAASPLEAKLARRLAHSRLPPPRRQFAVRSGGRTRYLDFAWPEAKIAVEVDGYRWHSSRGAWESDRARLRELRRAGWTVVQVTYEDVTRNFDAVADEVSALVAP